ncbi:MAG: hypothetical protein LH631_14350 [Alkalinema sp. CAN_BIN05]|nr:hypothetical protein [Alkalinema sp. CAN_BIN05]
MRSRYDKRRRSRISPIDRLLQSSKGIAILAADRPTTQTPVQPSSKPKRKNIVKRAVYRLQHPVGWWPLIVLGIIWILMLGIIWGAFQEIISLGASPAKQTIMQLERKSLIELFGALCLGGIGLSLALTPALKRPRRDNPELLQANIDRTTNK